MAIVPFPIQEMRETLCDDVDWLVQYDKVTKIMYITNKHTQNLSTARLVDGAVKMGVLLDQDSNVFSDTAELQQHSLQAINYQANFLT